MEGCLQHTRRTLVLFQLGYIRGIPRPSGASLAVDGGLECRLQGQSEKRESTQEEGGGVGGCGLAEALGGVEMRLVEA